MKERGDLPPLNQAFKVITSGCTVSSRANIKPGGVLLLRKCHASGASWRRLLRVNTIKLSRLKTFLAIRTQYVVFVIERVNGTHNADGGTQTNGPVNTLKDSV